MEAGLRSLVKVLFVEDAGARFHLLDRSVPDDLFVAGADRDLADGTDHGVSQHGHAQHVAAFIQLRAHGEEAIRQTVTEEEVDDSLGLKSREGRCCLSSYSAPILPLF